jgi:hypothetical protein
MLVEIFHQHNRTLSILTVVFLIATIGCGSKTVDLTTSQDHPANPNAQQGAAADHHSMPMAKMQKENMPMMEMHEKDAGHSSAELSPDGAEALGAMLDAYLDIGNQLASDTMDNVSANAHAMLEAFRTIEHEVPAELWSAHISHTETIHDAGHQLADISDIKSARIAYGSLSDSFRHFIAAVGVPASYKQPIYSYVCGMAPDVPEAGIWLQTEGPVRNPYFGSAMLRCHSTKTQMSVASTDMSGEMDMESHKHSH